ncbi:MAG: protein kinase [Lachnospiraceae bacterium]|nr:protein kinase [Lachnospiraceae bacterium]
MRDDEQTMYINGDNTEESKGESTIYIGGQQESGSDDQTVYIGSDNVTLKEDIQSTDTIQSVSEENETVIDRRVEETADFSEPLYYLPTNTMLQKRYRINTVLGEGGFGITYSGWDVTLNIPVAIKEYYPSGLVTRNATLGKTTQVVPVASAKYGTQFRDGIDRVLDEARRMAKFRNTPGIVGIYDFFEANNTAYIVMEYVNGCTLDKYCKNNRMDNTTLFNMLVPVMDALQALHNEGIIHRDISPDNIMVDDDGNFKLLDFGAARGYSEESATTMSVILKKSYAPEEQFRSKGVQGPWTDVYALGATIYELITGQTPPTSIDRLVEDEIVEIKVLAPALTKSQSDAIMTALAIRQKDRWQSVTEFKNALLRNPSNLINNNREHTTKNNDNINQKENKNNTFDEIGAALRKIPKKIYGIGIGILVILIVVISITKSLGNKGPGFLGIYAENIPSSISMQYDVSEGVYITGIYADTPASRSSLDVGDIIVKINSTNIADYKDFSDLMSKFDEGDRIKIEFLHLENGEYIKKNERIKLANKNEQNAIGILVNSIDTVSTDNTESYVSADGIIQAHLHTVSHNLSSYFAYIEFTNETDEDVIVKSKDIYLNGIPTDTAGKRKLGIVPANSTIILSSYISLDVLINEGTDVIDSFEILFYLGDDDSALYHITEDNLSITIDYLDKDLEKVNSNKSVGTSDKEDINIEKEEAVDTTDNSDVVAAKNDDVDIVEAPETETKVSIPVSTEDIIITLYEIRRSYSYAYISFLVENNSDETVVLTRDWTYVNDTSIKRATQQGLLELAPHSGAVQEYGFDLNIYDAAVGDNLESLELDFKINDSEEATPFILHPTDKEIKDSISRMVANEKQLMGDNLQSENLEVEIASIEESYSYVYVTFTVKNKTNSEINLGTSWAYFNGAAVKRSVSNGSHTIGAGKKSVIVYAYDKEDYYVVKGDKLDIIRLQFFVNEADEPERFFFEY